MALRLRLIHSELDSRNTGAVVPRGCYNKIATGRPELLCPSLMEPIMFSKSLCTFLVGSLLALALGSPVAAQQAREADAKYAIPASDEGLLGEGPIRRYDWFRKLWQTKRSGWAELPPRLSYQETGRPGAAQASSIGVSGPAALVSFQQPCVVADRRAPPRLPDQKGRLS